MNNSQLINQTSLRYEYYTPSNIIESARFVMGSIDLDPASSEQANKIVRAKKFYTEQDNGLGQPWFGNVWLNHPFGRTANRIWIKQLCMGHADGRINQAMCITYACTSENWFQPLFDYPMCFLSPRTNYYLPDGSILKGVTKGSVVTYLGPWKRIFLSEFTQFGKILFPAV